jgi:hypothetical protein
MSFNNWRNWLTVVNGTRTRHGRFRPKPAVEQLEDRRLLTAVITMLRGMSVVYPPDFNFISFAPPSLPAGLQGTANAGDTVTIAVNGTALTPTTTAFPNGIWFYTVPTANLTPDGDYTISATDSNPLDTQHGEINVDVDSVENPPPAPAFAPGQETLPPRSGLTHINQPGLVGTCDPAPHGGTRIDMIDRCLLTMRVVACS